MLYRLRQFWLTIFVRADPVEIERVKFILNARQMELFSQLQPAEKAHAVELVRKLKEQGENQPDLLVAALLHDIGKLRYILNPVERSMIVLAQAVSPGLARRWGRQPSQNYNTLPRWRKAFVLAEHHPAWGAEMARNAGVSSLAQTLIREHHHPSSGNLNDTENDLLRKLWIVDNNN